MAFSLKVSILATYEKVLIVTAKPPRRVRSIIYPLAMLVVFMSGCVSLPKEVYRGYSGAELPDASLALLDIGKADTVQIDGMYYLDGSKYTIVKLLPGLHRLDWSNSFGVSVMVDPRMIVDFRANATVTMEAGHIYRLQAERTLGPGYRVYMWIDDASTGTVVAGDKKR